MEILNTSKGSLLSDREEAAGLESDPDEEGNGVNTIIPLNRSDIEIQCLGRANSPGLHRRSTARVDINTDRTFEESLIESLDSDFRLISSRSN
jgi:hypothetical protein